MLVDIMSYTKTETKTDTRSTDAKNKRARPNWGTPSRSRSRSPQRGEKKSRNDEQKESSSVVVPPTALQATALSTKEDGTKKEEERLPERLPDKFVSLLKKTIDTLELPTNDPVMLHLGEFWQLTAPKKRYEDHQLQVGKLLTKLATAASGKIRVDRSKSDTLGVVICRFTTYEGNIQYHVAESKLECHTIPCTPEGFAHVAIAEASVKTSAKFLVAAEKEEEMAAIKAAEAKAATANSTNKALASTSDDDDDDA